MKWKLYSKSISKRILSRMTIRIFGVFLITAVFTYFHNKDIFDKSTLEYLDKYSAARAAQESDYFKNAEANVQILHDEYLRRISEISTEQAKRRFNEMIAPGKDKLYRAKGKFSDFRHFATVAIMPKVEKSDLFYKAVVTAMDVASQFGPPFRNRYFDTFFPLFGNDANILYMPEADYSLLTGEKELLVDYESETGSSPEKNPFRKTFWTSVYFDEAVKKWMISVAKPIDYQGRWIGGTGHDLLIDDVIARTMDVNMPGAYNVIFNEKGELIASKKFSELIVKSGGQLDLQKIADPTLLEIWNHVSKEKFKAGSFHLKEANSFIGVSRIEGPNWTYVTVYPDSLVFAKATDSIITVLLITLIALVIELAIIAFTLKSEVSRPLSEFIKATKNMENTNVVSQLPTQREDELGELALSFTNMVSEVTENRKQLEIQVKERTSDLTLANAQLTLKNKSLDELNKHKNDFIAIATHDLKNPLLTITSNIQLIKLNFDKYGKDKIVSQLEKAESQTKRMMLIIADYLNYIAIEERTEEVSLQEVDLNQFVAHLSESNSESLAKKSIRLHQIVPPNLNLVTDKNILTHILDNLVSNAIKFSEPNKNIYLRLTENEFSVQFHIIDEGQGIPKDEQPKLFERFAKLTPKPTAGEHSSGVGLAIVKQLTEKLGGKISIFSDHGQGCTFTVEIPKVFGSTRASNAA